MNMQAHDVISHGLGHEDEGPWPVTRSRRLLDCLIDRLL
ncbi:hypothetical protein LOK49_LG03G03618 [Camellia lanceoleosa]|uniref:Uncharacterized protein n=1 Tax=Camellia lanceoleosa TaxID=1840588 RepID=A0ACC0IBZ1_9ERIC|nr:hypothetical protein LOK49_LG03G03618 [Camellia lanceoleosa]